ncbi:Ubiquitin carboxyl-terminal hydrolase 7 [Aphelenchoides besseyi]|nr:Ubiquitin carboxyl-terminal hydrolase 7 [Aphelenchoides besseyi]
MKMREEQASVRLQAYFHVSSLDCYSYIRIRIHTIFGSWAQLCALLAGFLYISPLYTVAVFMRDRSYGLTNMAKSLRSLQCNGESGADQDNWSCQATAHLRVVSQKPGVDNHQRKISHTFHPKENDWGYSQFIQCDVLLDENNGYIHNDTVRLEVDVSADAPHGVHWDSKRHAGYIGLRNQGATCYMNSILQTLFFTNKLRKAVYLMPTEEDDQDSSTFCGSMVLNIDETIMHYCPFINKRLGLPRDNKLDIYLEVSPDHVYPVNDMQKAIRLDRNMVVDGIILIIEDSATATTENNCSIACNQMFAHMQVEAIPNSDVYATTLNSNADVFSVDVQMDASLTQFCEALGQRLDYDPKKIVLWRSTSPTERPNSLMTQEDFQRSTMHDLIATNGNFVHDPRNCRPYTVYYSKIPIPFEQLDNHIHCRVSVMDHKYQIREFSVFPPKDGTIADIAKGAQEFFEFSQNGTKKLRVVQVSNTPSQSRVSHVLDDNLPIAKLAERSITHSLAPIASPATLRVEEVPADQLSLNENEMLLSVSHYEKEPSKMFDVPFLIKVINEEPAANVKAHVKEVLEVSDREFEKFQFSIIIGSRIIRDLDQPDQTTINIEDLRPPANGGYNSPLLGIDHANRIRSVCGYHTNKAIVIQVSCC